MAIASRDACVIQKPLTCKGQHSKCYVNILLLSNLDKLLLYLCLPRPSGQRRPRREAKESIFKPQLGSRGCATGRRAPTGAQKSNAHSKGGRFPFRQPGVRRLPDNFLQDGQWQIKLRKISGRPFNVLKNS